MTPIRRFLFEPRTTAPMALVRVGWGAVMVAWTLSLLPDVDPFLTSGALRYDRTGPAGSWNPLDWISWRGAPLAACLLLLVAAVTTMVGYRTRLSTVVAVVCLISVQRTNTTILNSGDLFLRQIGIALALSPCGLLWSLDARGRPRPSAPDELWRAPWAQRLLQLEVCLAYLLSAWAKVRGATWREGTALARALRIEDLQRLAAPEWLFHSGILTVLTWSTLAFEASFALLVWNRRMRPWVLGVGIAFHLGIDMFLDVGYFSWAMWIAYLAFLFPDFADRVVGRVSPIAASDRAGAQQVALTVEPAE